MKKCIQCGELLENSEAYCLYCGASQNKYEQAQANENPSAPRRIDLQKRVPKEVDEESKQQSRIEKERQRKANDEKLKRDYAEAIFRSTHDALTGIGNRSLFEQRMNERHESRFWIAYIDINDFKKFNDKHNHEIGDLALKAVARAMKRVFGEDNSFRVGGDEFAVIFEAGSKEDVEESINTYRLVLEEESKSVFESTDERIDSLKSSVGIALNDGLKDIQAVINEADEMMYEDKKRQKPKKKLGESSENYNDNFDGYYNDVVPDDTKLEKEYTKISAKRILLVVAVVALVIIFDQVF